MNQLTFRSVLVSLVCGGALFAPSALAQEASAEVAVEGDDGAVAVGVEANAGVDANAGVAVVEAGPPPAVAMQAGPPPRGTVDGVRFRGAIAASGGGEFGSYGGGSLEVGMGGIEGRVGVQINNLIGIYVQPSLSFGVGRIGAINDAFTATAAATALIDFTIADYFFVAAGGGVGILNNPIGPAIHFRVGAYPVIVFGEDGYSRQGLMLGVDTRIYFLSDAFGDLIIGQIMGTIGYEVF